MPVGILFLEDGAESAMAGAVVKDSRRQWLKR